MGAKASQHIFEVAYQPVKAADIVLRKRRLVELLLSAANKNRKNTEDVDERHKNTEP